MTQLHQTLQRVIDNCTIAQAFLAKYPKFSVGNFQLDQEQVRLTTWAFDYDRESILSTFAEAFGPYGWRRDLQNAKHYSWQKIVDGVEVIIFEAEVIPPPTKPEEVSPKDFPLMLSDKQEFQYETDPASFVGEDFPAKDVADLTTY